MAASPSDPMVLYEDNHCLALFKPAGMLVASDETGDATLLDQARTYLKERYQKPGNVFVGLVHRLDRPVSGIVLFARTSKAAARLSEQFRTGTVRKTYRALVEGVPDRSAAELRDWLIKDETRNQSRVVPPGSPGARECRLDYRVLSIGPRSERALLEVTPKTGRSHQIRVQLSSRGWTIVGDSKYGASPLPDRSIALHAAGLTFTHPTLKTQVALAIEPSPEWAKWLKLG